MPGIQLFDALTVAARRLNGCCVHTLNKDIGDRPHAKHVAVEASGLELTVTVDCPVCSTKSVIRTDGANVKVERGAAGTPPATPSAH
jgi:hypothetical protein